MADPAPAAFLDLIERVSGSLPGYRRAHSRGLGLRGTFTAAEAARGLTLAEHFQGEPVPCVVRFSNAAGNPCVPDRLSPGNGRVMGMAVRFGLPSGKAATWAAINIPAFPARNPEEFMALTAAQAPKRGGKPSAFRLLAHLIRHLHIFASIKAIKALKPARSFALETFHGLHTYYLASGQAQRRPFRYRWVPVAAAAGPGGDGPLSPAEAAALPGQYLLDEVRARVGEGPLAWDLIATFPAEGDPLEDSSAAWGPGREEIALGRLGLERVHEDQKEVEGMVFDPTGVVPGLELSDDPILRYRSLAYSESFARRARETRTAPAPADMGQ
jgi:catalase